MGGRAYTFGLYSNLGTLNTKGLDYTFNWKAALADIAGPQPSGVGGLQRLRTWLLSYEQQTAPAAAINELDGTGSYFRYRTVTGLSYEIGPASVQLLWTHLPGIRNSVAATQPSTTILPTSKYNVFNLSAGFEFSKSVSMRLGIDNLPDRLPPVVGAQPGITNGGGKHQSQRL